MKPVIAFAALFLFAFTSCKKEDDKLVSIRTYKDVIYAIDNSEPSLEIVYSKAQYDNDAKGNIDQDTVITLNGFTQIPATVLAGTNARLYALSYTGDNFSLQIKDNEGKVLAQSDSVTFDPANQLHPDRYYTNISITP